MLLLGTHGVRPTLGRQISSLESPAKNLTRAPLQRENQ